MKNARRVYNNIILTLLFYSQISAAQTPVSLNPDLKNPTKIGVNRTYTFPKSPIGFGETQEFPIDPQRSTNYFEEERNTAWFLIDIPINGLLFLEITPHKVEDDYDWMLFEQNAQLKDAIANNTAPLLRSNNSRNDSTIDSKTGIQEGFENLYEQPGPGNSYSKPLEVKKGEQLILVIDNIYPDGGGFDLKISLKYHSEESGFLEGFIKDQLTNEPLKATITIEDDATGTFLAETLSDSIGKYKIVIPLKTSLNVVAQHPQYLFQSTDIMASDLLTNQDFLLDKIAAGNKLVLHNIHFAPNKDVILHTSDAELTRLINFLKTHPEFMVRLVGHSNSNVFANTRYLQTLSFNRAIAVKKVLLQNGIPEKRISCAGMGGKYPIIKTNDPVIGAINLRVEVVLQKIMS